MARRNDQLVVCVHRGQSSNSENSALPRHLKCYEWALRVATTLAAVSPNLQPRHEDVEVAFLLHLRL